MTPRKKIEDAKSQLRTGQRAAGPHAKCKCLGDAYRGGIAVAQARHAAGIRPPPESADGGSKSGATPQCQAPTGLSVRIARLLRATLTSQFATSATTLTE